ncbi:MAG: hypothetical protein CR217_17315 [Beijerinckiaceae bacterium]|nr:MAG: hypothetical protein CR217_17315 [Beijerinckiaceae bacterium]
MLSREGQGFRAQGSSIPWRISFARPRIAAHFRFERLPIGWNPSIDQESLKIKELEQVLAEKV